VFGPDAGEFVCRLVLLSAGTIATIQSARRYATPATAVLSIAWLCFVPGLPRSILWTYCDLARRSNATKDYEPTASPSNTVRHPKKRTRRVVSEMMDNSYGDDDAVSDSKSSPKDSTPL
jgi:hypothetical protein